MWSDKTVSTVGMRWFALEDSFEPKSCTRKSKMKTTLFAALWLASGYVHAEVNYDCDARKQASDCVTTPPITIGNPDGFD